MVGDSDVADLAEGEQGVDRRGGLGAVDLFVEDVEDEEEALEL